MLPDIASSYRLEPVGIMHSCFQEKFAIPRQPQLAPSARGIVQLLPPYDTEHATQGLEQVSHVWLLFLFHKTLQGQTTLAGTSATTRGNQTLGVFASRATHRPNGLGQSVVRLDRLEPGRLHVSGIDLLDGTPIIDIKPYVPYADIRSQAHNHIADAAPATVPVTWSATARQQAQQHQQRLQQPLVDLIEECLAQDPRPAYQQPNAERRYGSRFWDVNVRWHYPTPDSIQVLEVERA